MAHQVVMPKRFRPIKTADFIKDCTNEIIIVFYSQSFALGV